MKILLVSEFFPKNKLIEFSGGVEARVYFTAKNLAKTHQVTVLTSLIDGALAQESMDNFKIIRIGPKRPYKATTGDIVARIKFVFNAIKQGIKTDAELVEGSNFLTHFIAKQISLVKKIPVVAWYPDVWVGQWLKNAGLAGILGEVLERFNLMRGFDGYIAISESTASKLRKYVNKKIEVIYCGVDPSEFGGVQTKFKFPTILSIARLAPYKNQQVLIKALSLLPKDLDARLIIVGSGPMLTKLKDLANGLQVSEKVEFRSNLTRIELINLIKSSHIFSLPSLVEGFGIATIEAAAAGLPYVNSDIKVQKEVTKDGLGGFLVDPQNPNDFAKAFGRLMTNQELYLQKGQDAKKLAKLYDWQKLTQQTERIYQDLV